MTVSTLTIPQTVMMFFDGPYHIVGLFRALPWRITVQRIHRLAMKVKGCGRTGRWKLRKITVKSSIAKEIADDEVARARAVINVSIQDS
jgi:hypothetical protein